MTAVLISINPKFVEKIASGEKTIEVRKSRPKLETPFKCYIYMTATKRRGLLWEYDTAYKNSKGDVVDGGQKVIGEFVCDRIEGFHEWELSPSKRFYEEEKSRLDLFLKESCLTYEEVCEYRKNLSSIKPLFGWHISKLKIYDKPKELSEFKRWNRTEENSPCAHTKWIYPDCKDCKACNLTRPPQSWCYVKEFQNG